MLPLKQEITTVMNNVHSIADEIPDKIYDKPRTVPYLHIEADKDHVTEQHGRYGEDENASFISKLVYLYEYRQESADAEGRYELVNSYYFSGLYPGTVLIKFKAASYLSLRRRISCATSEMCLLSSWSSLYSPAIHLHVFCSVSVL